MMRKQFKTRIGYLVAACLTVSIALEALYIGYVHYIWPNSEENKDLETKLKTVAGSARYAETIDDLVTKLHAEKVVGIPSDLIMHEIPMFFYGCMDRSLKWDFYNIDSISSYSGLLCVGFENGVVKDVLLTYELH